IAEDMRMAADHLVAESVEDVDHRELALLAGHLAVEDDLEQEIAELFEEMVPGVLVDGRHDLVGFFDQIRLQRAARLFPIPRTTTVAAQASHEREEGIETVTSRSGHR